MSYKHDAIELFFSRGVYLPTRTIILEGNTEGLIDSTVASSFLKAFQILTTESSEPITIYLSSSGGNIVDGFAIHDAIYNSEPHVTIVVTGEAQSMAAIVLQAADHRVAYPHAVIMLHDGLSAIEARYRDVATFMDFQHVKRRQMYDVLSKRCGQPVAFWRRKLKDDWYMDAQKALAEKIIDEVYG